MQLFLRSGETDITANFEKQPKLGLEEIINKYRNVFNELAGVFLRLFRNSPIVEPQLRYRPLKPV